MKYIIQLVSVSILITGIIGYSSCVDDPQPNIGIEIPDTILINTWDIERFTVDTADFTEDFQSFTIEFLQSRQLVFRDNGVLVQIDPTLATWNLNIGNALFISVDIPEPGTIDPRDPNFIRLRTLTQLSKIYVASFVTEDRIELFNRNPDIATELILVSR